MQKNLHLIMFVLFIAFLNKTDAQVTQVNNNNSLSGYPIFPNSIFLSSDVDSTLWISDGTKAGTKQYAFNVKMDNNSGGGVFNGKIYFAGIDAAHGSELWVTDGTAAGTKLVQDIQAGAASSQPDNFVTYKNNLYFTDSTLALGRELYRMDGATGVVSLFKDINPGAASSFENTLTSFTGINIFFVLITFFILLPMMVCMEMSCGYLMVHQEIQSYFTILLPALQAPILHHLLILEMK